MHELFSAIAPWLFGAGGVWTVGAGIVVATVTARGKRQVATIEAGAEVRVAQEAGAASVKVAQEAGAASVVPQLTELLKEQAKRVDTLEQRLDREAERVDAAETRLDECEGRHEKCLEENASIREELEELRGDNAELRGIVIRRDSDVSAVLERTADMTAKFKTVAVNEAKKVVRKALSDPKGIPVQTGTKPTDEEP